MMRTLLVCAAALSIAFPLGAQDLTTFVETDDGIQLATDVYWPEEGGGPWPAVLIRTPYGKDRPDMVEDCHALAAADLACVIQDERSWGGSEGEYDFMGVRGRRRPRHCGMDRPN